MARGDFIDAGYSSLPSPRGVCKVGFWWRYANTSQEAINTNSDIIEVYPYITRTATNYSPYSNTGYYSHIDMYVYNSSSTYTVTQQAWKNKYNYGNVTVNTKYGLTSDYNSSNPFGYVAHTSTTYITTITKDGKTIYGTRFPVPHNQDGTAPRVDLNLYLGISDTHGSQVDHSITLSLDTIPRASKPTCAGTSLGTEVNIYTNRVSNSFTHTLNIKVGGTTRETFTSITDSKSWTPSYSTYLPLISGTSATAIIECITYNGSTQIGTATTSCVLTVPNNSDTKPTASVSIAKGDNVVPSTWGVYVKGKSKLAVTITGTPKAGTSIASYYSTANGSTYTSNSYTTGALTGSGTVTANVKDGRGFTSSNATASYTVVDYANPQITTSTVARCNSSGTLTDDGTYVKYSFKGSISSVSNKNSKTFTLKYKEKSASSWTTIQTWTSAYTLNQTNQLFGSGNIDITKEYIFRFEATDSFTTTVKEITVGTVTDLMNFNASGKSMAFGMVSQRGASESVLDFNMETQFHKPTIVASIRSKNIFNKNNVLKLNAKLTSGELTSSNSEKTLYISCKANTTYTISKIISERFRVAEVSTFPTVGMSITNRQTTSTTYLTYTTSSSAKYLLLNYYVNTDTSTEQQIIDSIQIETGSTATTYMPYQNLDGMDVYSSDEIVIGTFLGKPLYRKVVEFGNLPNATTGSVNHEISNYQDVITLKGTARTSTFRFPIPQATTNTSQGTIAMWMGASTISIKTTTDMSAYTAFVIVEYTKTTD